MLWGIYMANLSVGGQSYNYLTPMDALGTASERKKKEQQNTLNQIQINQAQDPLTRISARISIMNALAGAGVNAEQANNLLGKDADPNIQGALSKQYQAAQGQAQVQQQQAQDKKDLDMVLEINKLNPEAAVQMLNAKPNLLKLIGGNPLSVSGTGEIKEYKNDKGEVVATSYKTPDGKWSRPASPKAEKDPADAKMKEFEQVTGTDPKTRGTPVYQRAFFDYHKKFKAETHITNVTGATGDQADVLADAVIKRELDPYSISKRSGLQALVFSKVRKLDPKFNFTEAAAQAKFQTSTGTMNTQALLNSITPMLDKLQDTGKVLGNSSLPGYNRAVNFLKEQTGSDDIVAFNNLRDDVIAEVERGLLGSGVLSDSKYLRAVKNVNSAQTYSQLQAAVKNIKFVIQTRLEALAAGPRPQVGENKPAEKKTGKSQKIGRFTVETE